MSGPARYGSGPAGDPQGRDVPFGPETSWPHGFRPLNERSRDGLESAYRAPDPLDTSVPLAPPVPSGPLAASAPGFPEAARRPSAGGPATPGRGFAYQQPAFDDFGYGDPGYSDPSYNGPRDHPPTGPLPAIQAPLLPPPSSSSPLSHGPAFPGGAAFSGDTPFTGGTGTPGSRWYSGGSANRAPEYQEASGPGFGYSGAPGIYPVTGAQEALPDYPVTGAQEALPDTGGYPDDWYGHPRLTDRVDDSRPRADLRLDDQPRPRVDDLRVSDQPRPSAAAPRAIDPRLDGAAAGPRAADPRLEGIRYDELRYDESDGPEYDEPLDDDSWLQELRRGGADFPNGPAGEQRRPDPLAPGHGQEASYPQRDRFPGAGPAGPLNPGPAAGAWRGPQPGNPMGPQGPRMQSDAVRSDAVRSDAGRRPGAPLGSPGSEAGFLGAPVGVLTPPVGTPVHDTAFLARPSGTSAPDDAFLAGPSAAPYLAPNRLAPTEAPVASGLLEARGVPGVRPGHGLDGPEITSSWPAQPSTDSAEDLAFEEFWQEDDGEGDRDYSRLFGDEPGPDQPAARSASKRRTGRRRGRSNDKRLWLALGGVVVVTAGAVAGILKFEFPSHTGPTHAMAVPNSIGSYERKVGLERQADLGALRNQVIKMSSGQASGVVSAVYESGDSTSGGSVQMIMFIGGHLANASPSASINGFTQQFPGAKLVSAGPMGGKAACVEEQPGTADSKAICVFFDDDSFGTLTSPTMNTTALANELLTVRSAVETVVKK